MNFIINTNITNVNIISNNNMIIQKICNLLKYNLVKHKSEMHVQNVKNKSRMYVQNVENKSKMYIKNKSKVWTY